MFSFLSCSSTWFGWIRELRSSAPAPPRSNMSIRRAGSTRVVPLRSRSTASWVSAWMRRSEIGKETGGRSVAYGLAGNIVLQRNLFSISHRSCVTKYQDVKFDLRCGLPSRRRTQNDFLVFCDFHRILSTPALVSCRLACLYRSQG